MTEQIVRGRPRDMAVPLILGGLVGLVAATIAYLFTRPAGCLPGGPLALLALVEVGLLATWVRLRSQARPLAGRPIVLGGTASLIAVGLALYAGLGVGGAACQVLLRQRTAQSVAPLRMPLGPPETVGVTGSKDPSHLIFQTPTVYAGVPALVTAEGDLPITFTLPLVAAIVGPAGPTITSASSSTTFSWTAKIPSGRPPADLPALSGGIAYASWYVRFAAAGRYQVPVSIGGHPETATVTVLPVPAGGHVMATTTPPSKVHPQLSIVNTGSTALALGGENARVLEPGQTATVTPGSGYSFTLPQNAPAGFSLQTNIYRAYGAVHYSGTVLRYHHYAVAYTGAAVTPPWWWLVIAALAVVLVSLAVALVWGVDRHRSNTTKEVN